MKKFKLDDKLSLTLSLELLLPAVKFCFVQSIPGLYVYNGVANLIISLILLVFILPSMIVVYKRNRQKIILFFLFLLVFIVGNCVLFPNNIGNIEEHIFRIFSVSFICFTIAYSLNRYDYLYAYLLKFAYIIIIAAFFMLVSTSIFGIVGAADTEYNMSLSYYCLVPILILIYKLFDSYNVKDILFLMVGVLVLFGMGSRGVFVGIILFILIYNLKDKHKTKKFYITMFTIISLLILILLNLETIVLLLIEFFEKIGIKSRTLLLLLHGNITSPSNRDVIISEMIEIINSNPFFGIGFLGDLRSHNIIVESLVFYGVILGSVFNFGVIVLIFNTIFSKYKIKEAILLLIFFCYAIPDAFLNLTIWGKDIFWIYLGLYFSMNRRGVIKKIYNDKNIAYRN